MNFVFDVDGTLTDSRQEINREFANSFLEFAKTHDCYLCTGSDRVKTLEQVGEVVYYACKRVYNCNGNDVWDRGKNIYTSLWDLPEPPWKHLESRLIQSRWRKKTGWHFDKRPGLVNFSVLGRNATTKERHEYFQWDEDARERESIAYELNYYYGEKYEITAVVAGETGVDIYPTGCDKSQILNELDRQNTIFFGDRIYEGGNDWSLAKALPAKNVYPVENWRQTWQILESLTSGLRL